MDNWITYNIDGSITINSEKMTTNSIYSFYWDGADCLVIQRGVGNLELFGKKVGEEGPFPFVQSIKTQETRVSFFQSLFHGFALKFSGFERQ